MNDRRDLIGQIAKRLFQIGITRSGFYDRQAEKKNGVCLSNKTHLLLNSEAA